MRRYLTYNYYQGMDREHGEEANITSDGEGDSVALGRGNRRRKKRKFFDDDGENQRGVNRKKRGSLDDEVKRRSISISLIIICFVYQYTFINPIKPQILTTRIEAAYF